MAAIAEMETDTYYDYSTGRSDPVADQATGTKSVIPTVNLMMKRRRFIKEHKAGNDVIDAACQTDHGPAVYGLRRGELAFIDPEDVDAVSGVEHGIVTQVFTSFNNLPRSKANNAVFGGVLLGDIQFKENGDFIKQSDAALQFTGTVSVNNSGSQTIEAFSYVVWVPPTENNVNRTIIGDVKHKRLAVTMGISNASFSRILAQCSAIANMPRNDRALAMQELAENHGLHVDGLRDVAQALVDAVNADSVTACLQDVSEALRLLRGRVIGIALNTAKPGRQLDLFITQ